MVIWIESWTGDNMNKKKRAYVVSHNLNFKKKYTINAIFSNLYCSKWYLWNIILIQQLSLKNINYFFAVVGL